MACSSTAEARQSTTTLQMLSRSTLPAPSAEDRARVQHAGTVMRGTPMPIFGRERLDGLGKTRQVGTSGHLFPSPFASVSPSPFVVPVPQVICSSRPTQSHHREQGGTRVRGGGQRRQWTPRSLAKTQATETAIDLPL